MKKFEIRLAADAAGFSVGDEVLAVTDDLDEALRLARQHHADGPYGAVIVGRGEIDEAGWRPKHGVVL